MEKDKKMIFGISKSCFPLIDCPLQYMEMNDKHMILDCWNYKIHYMSSSIVIYLQTGIIQPQGLGHNQVFPYFSLCCALVVQTYRINKQFCNESTSQLLLWTFGFWPLQDLDQFPALPGADPASFFSLAGL